MSVNLLPFKAFMGIPSKTAVYVYLKWGEYIDLNMIFVFLTH